MTIDGTKVKPHSARYFRAIGGGFGVKMRLFRSEEEYLLGTVPTQERAAEVVTTLNNQSNGAAMSSAKLMGGHEHG